MRNNLRRVLALGDGNCQFRGISISRHGNQSQHLRYRAMAAKEIDKNEAFYSEFSCDDHPNENNIETPGTFGGNASAVAVAKSTQSKITIYEGQQIVFEFNGGEKGEIYLEYIRGPPGHYNGLVPIIKQDKVDDTKFDKQDDQKFKKVKRPIRCYELLKRPEIKLNNFWSALETEGEGKKLHFLPGNFDNFPPPP